MRQGIWRNAPALAISILALFIALGGSVYAAKKARINGKAIKAKSIPGNRVKPRSLPANRLRPKLLRRLRAASGPVTGTDINELTLGQVPTAEHAERADTAASATDAQTALNAVNAIDAKTVNGYGAGCLPSTLEFAGACWETSPSSEATAPVAAAKCAARGGTLPEALQLAAFAAEPGVNLHGGDEWSGDIPVFTGLDTYGVATVSPASEINSVVSTETRAYRCVIPLLA